MSSMIVLLLLSSSVYAGDGSLECYLNSIKRVLNTVEHSQAKLPYRYNLVEAFNFTYYLSIFSEQIRTKMTYMIHMYLANGYINASNIAEYSIDDHLFVEFRYYEYRVYGHLHKDDLILIYANNVNNGNTLEVTKRILIEKVKSLGLQ